MSDAKKREGQPRRRLFPFIIVWALGCFLASWLVIFLLAEVVIVDIPDAAVYLLVLNLGLFAAVATIQFFVIRRLLHVELRGWMPLSLAGVVVGVIAFKIFSELIPLTANPWYLYPLLFLLVWGMPSVFQWFLLRKRFANHGLWLLAAVVAAPVFSFIFIGGEGAGGGLLTQVLALLPNSDSLLWTTAAYATGLTLPTVILGLILYVVVTGSGKADALENAVE